MRRGDKGGASIEGKGERGIYAGGKGEIGERGKKGGTLIKGRGKGRKCNRGERGEEEEGRGE